jgi:hypothetical protein
MRPVRRLRRSGVQPGPPAPGPGRAPRRHRGTGPGPSPVTVPSPAALPCRFAAAASRRALGAIRVPPDFRVLFACAPSSPPACFQSSSLLSGGGGGRRRQGSSCLPRPLPKRMDFLIRRFAVSIRCARAPGRPVAARAGPPPGGPDCSTRIFRMSGTLGSGKHSFREVAKHTFLKHELQL